jgi:hypothetical protein
MTMADKPPPEVERAAKIVDDWLRGAPSVTANAPRPPSAAERFAKMARPEKPVPQPAWKDPRTV